MGRIAIISILVIASIALFPQEAYAAGTAVQTITGSDAYVGSLGITFGSDTTSGNTVICSIVYNNDTAGDITSVSDGTNSFSAANAGTVGDIDVAVWYAFNITGLTTPTVTITMGGASHDIAAICREVSGLTTTDPLDQISGTATAAGTSHTSAATPTTSQANEYIMGTLGIETNSTYTAGTGYSNVSNQNGSDLFESIGIEEKNVTSVGAQTATFTTGSSAAGYFIVTTWKESAAGNSRPTITSVTDTPDPVSYGLNLVYSVDWNDADGEGIHLYVCDTNATSTSGCGSTTYCSYTASYSTNDPLSCSYTTQQSDVGTLTAYTFVCDNEGDSTACSDTTTTTTTVQNPPVPQIYLNDGVFQINNGSVKLNR